ncbi:MAG: hypothetical protein JWR83_2467 [Aeromicrobium sp.]|nr:hypothetical protein [Aeromicrobium sp.]
MNTSTVAPEIVKFAAAVREALADLPEEERDELTDGLEADLSESLAEDLRRTLPDPIAYAAELRAAAGLPARGKVRGGLSASWRETVSDIRLAIRRHPALHSLLEFLTVLRPAWWLVRAWVAYYLVFTGNLFGDSRGMISFAPLSLAMFLLFVVVSVQWGRGEWLPRSGLPWLIGAGNVLALLLLLPAISHANTTSSTPDTFDAYPAPLDGLAMNGQQISNIFAYGHDGKLLRSVQLFDQSGQPLDPFGSQPGDDGPCANDDCTSFITPRSLETGAAAYNVYPQSTVRTEMSLEQGRYVPVPGATPTVPTAPFLKVPAVLPPEKVAKSNH